MQHTKSQIVKPNESRVGICLSGLFLVLTGCQTTNNSPPQATVKAPDLPPPAASAGDPPSVLLLRHGHRTSEEWGDDAAGTHRSVW